LPKRAKDNFTSTTKRLSHTVHKSVLEAKEKEGRTVFSWFWVFYFYGKIPLSRKTPFFCGSFLHLIFVRDCANPFFTMTSEDDNDVLKFTVLSAAFARGFAGIFSNEPVL